MTKPSFEYGSYSCTLGTVLVKSRPKDLTERPIVITSLIGYQQVYLLMLLVWNLPCFCNSYHLTLKLILFHIFLGLKLLFSTIRFAFTDIIKVDKFTMLESFKNIHLLIQPDISFLRSKHQKCKIGSSHSPCLSQNMWPTGAILSGTCTLDLD